MQEGWRGGRSEGTPCGGGSLSQHTENVRRWVPDVMRRYGFETICDAGAGDLCWTRDALSEFDYRPFDLVPRAPGVEKFDITKDKLPDCDVILCRAVLIHLDPPRVFKALDLFRQASRYLLATTELSDNVFDSGDQCNPIDLSKPPFDLGEPLESIGDLEGKHSRLALWRI
jgi:hypothetical protein